MQFEGLLQRTDAERLYIPHHQQLSKAGLLEYATDNPAMTDRHLPQFHNSSYAFVEQHPAPCQGDHSNSMLCRFGVNKPCISIHAHPNASHGSSDFACL